MDQQDLRIDSHDVIRRMTLGDGQDPPLGELQRLLARGDERISGGGRRTRTRQYDFVGCLSHGAIGGWRINVVTRPASPHIPRQRIHLEACNVPSYASELMPLKRNYDFLPDGYEDMVIRVETKEEIFADKLVAFPAMLPRYTRWRDIWDMRWLTRQDVPVNTGMVEAKIADYRIEGFAGLLDTASERMTGLVNSPEFVDQMDRFLTEPAARTTVRQPGWRDVAARELQEILTGLAKQLAQRQAV